MLFQLRRIVSRTISKSFYSHTTLKMSSNDINGAPLANVVTALEDFAPKHLSESWDNTGLLVEPYTERNITKVLLTNDLTEDVALEAVRLGCEMILSYHPPIFSPLKSIIQSSWKERIVSLLLENRIALYSPHTSWDSVQGGVNDWLGSGFHSGKSTPIKPGIVPYLGAGRFLELKEPITLSEAVKTVKTVTGLSHVRFAIGKDKTMESSVENVALCAGSGSSILKGVNSDLYLTGEMLHHDVLDATQKGISVILTNHSDSERGFLKVFSKKFEQDFNKQISFIVSENDRDPLITV